MPDDTDLPLACQDHESVTSVASQDQWHPTLRVWSGWCTKTDEGGIGCLEYRYIGRRSSVTAQYAEREMRRIVAAVLDEVRDQLRLEWHILATMPGDTDTTFKIYLVAVSAK